MNNIIELHNEFLKLNLDYLKLLSNSFNANDDASVQCSYVSVSYVSS